MNLITSALLQLGTFAEQVDYIGVGYYYPSEFADLIKRFQFPFQFPPFIERISLVHLCVRPEVYPYVARDMDRYFSGDARLMELSDDPRFYVTGYRENTLTIYMLRPADAATKAAPRKSRKKRRPRGKRHQLNAWHRRRQALERDLQRCVDQQEFHQAARVRDELKKVLESKPNS
jgi:UvrB/uvrC motif